MIKPDSIKAKLKMIAVNEGKQFDWCHAFRKWISSNVELEFPEIINVLKVFIEPAYHMILTDDNFQKTWNPNNREWK